MCLAIVNYEGVIDQETFYNADMANPDGMGMLWLNNKGELVTLKQMEKVGNFWKSYVDIRTGSEPHCAKAGSAILIHFRWATHGTKNTFNCHPFMVNPKLGFIHNGVFRNVPSDKKRSDTQMFNELILKKLPRNFLGNQGIMELLTEFSSGSKVCFLDHKGAATIINMEDGYYDEGSWYSNSSGFFGRRHWTAETEVATPAAGAAKQEELRSVVLEGPKGELEVYYGEAIDDAIEREYGGYRLAYQHLAFEGETLNEMCTRLEDEAEKAFLKLDEAGTTVSLNAETAEIMLAIEAGKVDGYGRPLQPHQHAIPRSTPQEARDCQYGCD